MRYIFSLLATLIFCTSVLSAQCEDLTTNCPEDLAYNLKVGENDTMFVVPPPDTSDCGAANLFYTINGPVGAAGNGVPGAFNFETGTSELTYQYTENRFGNFPPEATLLPDGDGAQYEIPFMVSGMGSTVGEAGGLTRICFVMEHSYLGDLDIWVSCPDGSTANLHEYIPTDNVTRQLLGQGDQNTETPDPGGLYCWAVGAARTMSVYVDDFNVGSNQMMPTIEYLPVQSLSRFDTCQIAGEWILHVRDNLARDNGSVYSAFVDFGANLAPPCVQEVKINQGTTLTNDIVTNRLAVKAYPNPVQDFFTVAASTTTTETAQLEVYTATGKLFTRQTATLSPGENTFQLSSVGWPLGVYSVRIISAGRKGSVKVVKVQD